MGKKSKPAYPIGGFFLVSPNIAKQFFLNFSMLIP